MKITLRQLRSAIRNILQEQMKVSPYGSGSGFASGQDAIDALHTGLAVISVADPTVITDLVDSFIYVLEGDNESAALVIAGSAAGLGAGAAVAKVAKARRAAKAAKDSGNISDEAFSTLSRNIDRAEDIAREAAENSRAVRAPPRRPGQSHFVNPGRGQRVTSSGQLVKAEPGTPRGQGGSRGGKSDPRMSPGGSALGNLRYEKLELELPPTELRSVQRAFHNANDQPVDKILIDIQSFEADLKRSRSVMSNDQKALKRDLLKIYKGVYNKRQRGLKWDNDSLEWIQAERGYVKPPYRPIQQYPENWYNR